jgi:hypothetical protein
VLITWWLRAVVGGVVYLAVVVARVDLEPAQDWL